MINTQYFFYASLLALLICVLAIWSVLRAQRLIVLWQGNGTRRTLLHNVSRIRIILRTCCSIGAGILLLIALSRPQWGTDNSTVTETGRTLLIALDISRSMSAQDIKPSRILYAKEKIRALLGQLKADRVGLLVFSDDALLLCPLTTDYEAFKMFLDNTAVEAVSSGTTSIGGALEKAVSAFGDKKMAGTRLIVLFTDGEDFAGHVPDVFEKIHAAGVQLCIVGIGSGDGGPIPIYDQSGAQTGFLRGSDGQIVISRPNKMLMKDLADKTHGIFIDSTSTMDDITRVHRWLTRFEGAKSSEVQQGNKAKEQFYWFTAGAFILLLVGFGL